jgi:hypothetical protein
VVGCVVVVCDQHGCVGISSYGVGLAVREASPYGGGGGPCCSVDETCCCGGGCLFARGVGSCTCSKVWWYRPHR